ncbi:gfo/Idh/MocA family oxidoreductase [Candidatus Poribacteria bacterium]|nr:MAG: gfo/Idh/MocA family oxidoreductase [Candidatus Poribacteria bacterium]
MKFKVGIIGCGGRGNAHAKGYAASEDVEMVACADPVEEKARALAEKFGIPRVYKDYREMLEKEKPDIVSICTWTPLHAQMVFDSVDAGVKAIHCEKPMAPTWGESKAIYRKCEEKGVVITFCHQRRFAPQFVKAKQLARDGTIGELYRVEGYCPNLFDWGTHWFDMFFFYNDDQPAEWVMGQIDCSQVREVFGVPVERYGLSYIKWKNGLTGLLVTGGDGWSCANRLIGTKGIIEVGVKDGPPLRVLREGRSWEVPDLKGVVPPYDPTTLSVLDLIDALKTGREPELSGRKALQATELIFATYESSRRRARIYLPLEIEDSPLLTMLEKGMV